MRHVDIYSTHCPSCGEHVGIPVTAGRLHVPLVGMAHCLFRCPRCGESVTREVNEPLLSTLVARGMPAERVDVTATPSYHRPGPPLTLDDLLTLHEQLAAL